MKWLVSYQIAVACLIVKANNGHENGSGDDKLLHDVFHDENEFKAVKLVSTCDGLSEDVGCTQCSDSGHCLRGYVPIDPWLQFALRTQREIQINKTFDHIFMFDAHNAYNNRADGYGVNDTCNWPPPLEKYCSNVGNQEFSLTDLLNMGVRALELDNWWCHNAMRLAHLILGEKACGEQNRLFSDAIKEIADWLSMTENVDEIIRIHLNEKEDQGHDSEVNGPLQQFLGSRIITPLEFNETYGYQWPTMRTMRQDRKNVVVATSSTAGTGEFYTHGDHFIHKAFWDDNKVKLFTDYPACGGKTRDTALRFYSDSTKYGPLYDGTKQTGTILDFTQYVHCDIQYPSADQINPDMMKTGVFTWAEGQPANELSEESCVILNGDDARWYVASSCLEEHFFACQSSEDPDEWAMSTSSGPFSLQNTHCPEGFQFSIPHDGYRQQKMLEVASGATVWLDYPPWLPGYTPVTPGQTTTDDAFSNMKMANLLLITVLITVVPLVK